MAEAQEQADPGAERPRKKKGSGVEPASMSLNMQSMIDVIFQLLIYFVITASFSVNEGIVSAKLPKQKGQGDSPEDPEPPEQKLKIFLTSVPPSGYRLRVKGRGPVENFDRLGELLKTMQYNPETGGSGVYKPDNPVIIEPEGRVRWQHVVNAFNAAVYARYENISFAAVQ